MDALKVSSKSSPSAVAGALAGVVRQHGSVEVQVVGAGALNQAIKAVAIARGYLTPSGVDLVCVPTFVDVVIDGQGRTGMRLLIEDRHGEGGPGAAVDLRDHVLGRERDAEAAQAIEAAQASEAAEAIDAGDRRVY